MNIHKEISFEHEICEHLATHGWLYEECDAQLYDRPRALFPADVVAWVKATQPTVWKTLAKNHGASAQGVLLDRIRKQISDRGTLEVLRHGVELIGLRQPIALAQFKPALAMNEDILARYGANRLRVVRQLRYSVTNQNCLDLVFFLNGIAVATAELKTDFTQSVEDAIDQYRADRDPRHKGKAAEPLLTFASGALVHFAISNSEVHMTTRLAGAGTEFLPFNKGNDGARGNPPNTDGHPTSYLWEEVWQRDSWLEIIGRYLVTQRDEKKKIRKIIFPRYHQLDATRKLQAKVLEEGAGGKFLIQHSAGSGKTNSIAWSAHFLADLHNAANEKLFNSVIVISDRNVIDGQLQDALFDFERTIGVVANIKAEGGSKSGQLVDALAAGKKIIVCTIQTFPFALAEVRRLAAVEGKRFVVIADEAHSSQSGQAALMLKQVLSPEELAELEDGGDVSAEDILAAQMAARVKEKGITYIAFTATPKPKTLELFGRRPRPGEPAEHDNMPQPFHVYSMRQAIEEGFILDVLRNYTPYRLAFRLAHNGRELDDEEVERDEALRSIMRWVRLHPYNISQKVKIVVEHFRENVAPLLEGHAKAMVVLGSRVEAVRWQIAIDKYIKSCGYKIATLVAFSGEVNDRESGSEPFTERSEVLNPFLKGRDIREAFGGDEYQILLVANKFQTGFDQPLLCGMYLDRRLAGIQAVQTLSRLNRAYPGKDTTYVLDFVNSSEEVLKAFTDYYNTAELACESDPNLVYDLRAKLDGSGHYDESDVDRVAAVLMDPIAKQGDLVAALTPVADRLLRRFRNVQEELRIAQAHNDANAAREARNEMEALLLFKADMGKFKSMYTFLSQIFDYGNTAIEKRFIFYRALIPLLDFGREREGVDLAKVKLTHHNLRDLGERQLPLGGGEGEGLKGLTGAGGGTIREEERLRMAEIIARVNDLFEGDLTEDDKLVYLNNVLMGKLLESEELIIQAENNSKAQFEASPTLSSELNNAIMDALAAHTAMSTQALNSARVRQEMKDILMGPAQLYETLRQRGGERRVGGGSC